MVLTMKDKQVLVFHGEGCLLPSRLQGYEIIENTNIFFYFLRKKLSCQILDGYYLLDDIQLTLIIWMDIFTTLTCKIREKSQLTTF